MKKLFAFLLVLGLTISQTQLVDAGKPRPAAWYYGYLQFAGLVEQQTVGGAPQKDQSLIVHNRMNDTGCIWDVDDSWYGNFLGKLYPGESISGSLCFIADWSLHQASMRVPLGLTGTITLPGHLTITIPGGQRGCIAGPDYELTLRGTTGKPSDPNGGWIYSDLLTTFPYSDGGVGIPTDIIFTLTNTSSRTVREIATMASITMAGISWNSNLCPYPIFSTGQRLYPVGHDPAVFWYIGD